MDDGRISRIDRPDGRDVVVRAPSAVGRILLPTPGQMPSLDPPTPEEVAAALSAENRVLRDELDKQKIVAHTALEAAMALLFALNDARELPADSPFLVARERIDELKESGVALTFRDEGGDTVITARERAPHHTWEG